MSGSPKLYFLFCIKPNPLCFSESGVLTTTPWNPTNSLFVKGNLGRLCDIELLNAWFLCDWITLPALQCVVTCGNHSIFFKKKKWGLKELRMQSTWDSSRHRLNLPLVLIVTIMLEAASFPPLFIQEVWSTHSIRHTVLHFSWGLSVDQSPEFRKD